MANTKKVAKKERRVNIDLGDLRPRIKRKADEAGLTMGQWISNACESFLKKEQRAA